MREIAKKAQFTIFIVLGVIVAMVVVFLYFLSNGLTFKQSSDVQDVETYVNQNAQIALQACLATVGLQGGLYTPDNYLLALSGPIQYAYNGGPAVPTIAAWKAGLEQCVETYLGQCLNGFKPLKDLGQQITHGNITAHVLFANYDVPLQIDIPITRVTGSEKKTFNTFNPGSAQVRLGYMHDIVAQIAKSDETLPKGSIDLTYLGSVSGNVTIYEMDGKKRIYQVEDSDSKLQNEAYQFLFGEST